MKMFSVMVFWTKIQFKFKIQFTFTISKGKRGGGGKHTKKNSDTILIAYIMSMFAKKRKVFSTEKNLKYIFILNYLGKASM